MIIYYSHAKNSVAGSIIPFSVLGFWDKTTMACAGAMPFRRDFPATIRDLGLSSQMEFSAWIS